MIKNLERILQFLPLGYLYLIILGILKETLLYNQLGVNILNYSSLIDTLIGPIADLTSNIYITIIVIFIVISLLLSNVMLVKHSHKPITRKIIGVKGNDISHEELKGNIRSRIVFFIAFGLLSFFLGIGWGQGNSIAKKIKNDKLENNRILKFNLGESQEVYLIGSNSQYYFYVNEENKNIRVAPIASIKEIEIIKNKKLDGTK